AKWGPVSEPRQEIAARALELAAGSLAPLFRTAPGRPRPAEARRQTALPDQPPDRKPGCGQATRRVEDDRQLAPAEPLQQRAQAVVRALVDGGLGGEPLAAPGPARLWPSPC